MNAFRPPSIRELGLQTYLDGTKIKHNGSNYADFKKLVDSRVTMPNIGRVFAVDRRTVASWIEVLKEEQKVDA